MLINWALIALGDRLTGSLLMSMVSAALVTLLAVIPADKYMEAHFAFLKPVKKGKASSDAVPPELETATEEEPQEEGV
jgi:hypothetical protein